eukprot:gene44272-65358_t
MVARAAATRERLRRSAEGAAAEPAVDLFVVDYSTNARFVADEMQATGTLEMLLRAMLSLPGTTLYENPFFVHPETKKTLFHLGGYVGEGGVDLPMVRHYAVPFLSYREV